MSSKTDVCFSLPVNDWYATTDSLTQKQAIDALENGRVVFLPNLAFVLTPEEKSYLRPDCVDPKGKSVKYAPVKKQLWGFAKKESTEILSPMLERYSKSAENLITTLFPGYAPALVTGNASYRPIEADGRIQSKRHDDRLLHVDAFPSRPVKGERILRVFTNINPNGGQRNWRVGESFTDVAARFLPRISAPFPGSAKLLKLLKITKGIRTAYDHYMLGLHDRMKLDDDYQEKVKYTSVVFPPGSSWIVFSDQVSHAAMSGQYLLEQTLAIPVSAMSRPETSPLKVLERMKGRALVQ